MPLCYVAPQQRQARKIKPKHPKICLRDRRQKTLSEDSSALAANNKQIFRLLCLWQICSHSAGSGRRRMAGIWVICNTGLKP
jgi:hypothetical protein